MAYICIPFFPFIGAKQPFSTNPIFLLTKLPIRFLISKYDFSFSNFDIPKASTNPEKFNNQVVQRSLLKNDSFILYPKQLITE